MRMIALVTVIASLAAGAAMNNTQCSATGWTGDCGISNDGSAVEIGGTDTNPGDTGGGGSGGGGGGGSAQPGVRDPEPCTGAFCRDGYSVAVIPDVTIADLARFVPARPSFVSEPDGVGIVGMPANIVARADTQYLEGTLFDYDVTVRFVPTAYRFDYGDGTVITAPTGGASWAAIGQSQFTPTSTSHVYAARGDYTASATVLYTAAVDFGTGSWRPVTGYVEASSGGFLIRVLEAHTALLRATCLENPTALGC